MPEVRLHWWHSRGGRFGLTLLVGHANNKVHAEQVIVLSATPTRWVDIERWGDPDRLVRVDARRLYLHCPGRGCLMTRTPQPFLDALMEQGTAAGREAAEMVARLLAAAVPAADEN